MNLEIPKRLIPQKIVTIWPVGSYYTEKLFQGLRLFDLT